MVCARIPVVRAPARLLGRPVARGRTWARGLHVTTPACKKKPATPAAPGKHKVAPPAKQPKPQPKSQPEPPPPPPPKPQPQPQPPQSKSKSQSESQSKSHQRKQQQPPPPSQGQAPSGKEDQKVPLSELVEKRGKAFIVMVIGGTIFMGYTSYVFTVFFRASEPPASDAEALAAARNYEEELAAREPAVPTGLPPTISRATAAEFDAGLDWPELVMGHRRLRRRLAAECRGDVLEVAVGTGRNFVYYDWDDIADVDPQLRTVRRLEKRGGGGGGGGKGGAGDGGEVEMASYTGVDVSADVLHLARRRIRDLVPGMKHNVPKARLKADEAAGEEQFRTAGVEEVLNIQDGKLRLVRADVQDGLPLPAARPRRLEPGQQQQQSTAPEVSSAKPGLFSFSRSSGSGQPSTSPPSTAAAAPLEEPAHYDVIVQTFGLCSVASPGRLLANMATVLKPGTGRILLLEHGRGGWDFVNNALDRLAPGHFARFGCWWNRDIERIVRDAAAAVPGLEVVSVKRPGVLQAGTTLLIELRVAAAGGPEEARSK
ncbi:hypothetical protein RB596_002638 [Gaeumannomyces avenae]